MSGRTKSDAQLDQLSERTRSRRRREWYLNNDINDSLSLVNDDLEMQVDQFQSDNLDVQMEEEHDDRFYDIMQDDEEEFYDPFDNEDLLDNEDDNINIENENIQPFERSDEQIDEQTQQDDYGTKILKTLNTVNLNVLYQLIDFFILNKTTTETLQQIIKLINTIIENIQSISYFPKSVFLLKKLFNKKISKKFSFTSPCCDKKFVNFKLEDNCICDCGQVFNQRDVITSKNYFFRFNLREQLKLLFEHFVLDNYFPGKIFKELSSNRTICNLTIFIDGVPIFKNNLQLWTLFVKANNLKAPLLTKTFLNGCLIGDHKPNLDQIKFFLKDLVEELNLLNEEGVFLKDKKRTIYPVFTLFLLDSGARPGFLNHSQYNTVYGCPRCLQEGEQCKSGRGHSHIYPFEDCELRTKDNYLNILRLINENIVEPPVLGIKGPTPLSELKYFNHLISCTPEPMHQLTIGIVLRNFNSFMKFKKFPCFIDKKSILILEKRIMKFAKSTYNSIFKRKLELFLNCKKWKANQLFQFYFYVFPVVFMGILNSDVFKMQIVLIFILSKLWSSQELDNNEIFYLDKLVKLYLSMIDQHFPRSNFTFNNHQLLHIIEMYVNHGCLKFNNAFVFESLNGLVIRQVRSAYGVLEQVAEKSQLNFIRNIRFAHFEQKSRTFKTNKKTKIDKIYNDFDYFTTCNRKSVSKDHFVMTNDNRFYKILEFFYSNEILFLKAYQFKIIDNFSIILNFSDESIDLGELESDKIVLDYIYNVELKDQIEEFPVNLIKEKVLFCPKFENNSDKFNSTRLGYIIRCNLEIHN